jgi:hypothetical protein
LLKNLPQFSTTAETAMPQEERKEEKRREERRAMYSIERCKEIVNSQTIAEQLPSQRSKKSFSKKIDNSYTSSRESFSDSSVAWRS